METTCLAASLAKILSTKMTPAMVHNSFLKKILLHTRLSVTDIPNFLSNAVLLDLWILEGNVIVKLRQGSGKDRQGMAVKAKGLKA